jgi:hypothetical protein
LIPTPTDARGEKDSQENNKHWHRLERLLKWAKPYWLALPLAFVGLIVGAGGFFVGRFLHALWWGTGEGPTHVGLGAHIERGRESPVRWYRGLGPR